MKIEIIAFGIARDIVGSRKVYLDVELPSTAEKIKEVIVQSYPDFLKISAFNIAIGDDYAHAGDIVNENDIITIIPPVSGG